MADLRTPLYDWHRHHNGRMVPFGGWDMPVQYTGIIDEHSAVRQDAGLFDISHMARLVLTGPDAEALIQHVWTNDAGKMKPGQVRYGLVCNEAGGVLDDILVTRFERLWLLVINASNRGKIVDWLNRHNDGRDCKIDDRTGAWAMVAVQGPAAAEKLAGVVGPVDRLKYYTAEQWDEETRHPISVVSRTGYTGEDGFEVILPAGGVIDFADDLVKAGVKPCGLGARDTLRLEAAMPLYGHELSETIDPYTAGLGWCVKLAKGDFVGRGVLAERKDDAGLRRRVGLTLEGKRAAREGCAVSLDGEPAGEVTSGSFAPALQKSIAMAFVDAKAAAPGTAVEVDIRGTATPAAVTGLPFYKTGGR